MILKHVELGTDDAGKDKSAVKGNAMVMDLLLWCACSSVPVCKGCKFALYVFGDCTYDDPNDRALLDYRFRFQFNTYENVREALPCKCKAGSACRESLMWERMN